MVFPSFTEFGVDATWETAHMRLHIIDVPGYSKEVRLDGIKSVILGSLLMKVQ